MLPTIGADLALAQPNSKTNIGDLVARYGDLDGRQLLQAMIEREFPGEIGISSSFGAESAVLLHLVSTIEPATPVLFLNTGKLFPETIAYRDLLVDRLGLSDVRVLRPAPADVAHQDPTGDLWHRDAEGCCDLRKVVPLKLELAGFAAWITGRKRFQAVTRSQLPKIEADGVAVKINPLAGWSADEVAAYMGRHKLPKHPLISRGFQSIGCAPCTSMVTPGDHARTGRWRGSEKTECGIHIANGKVRPAADPKAA